jgi:hypothetical protein
VVSVSSPPLPVPQVLTLLSTGILTSFASTWEHGAKEKQAKCLTILTQFSRVAMRRLVHDEAPAADGRERLRLENEE